MNLVSSFRVNVSVAYQKMALSSIASENNDFVRKGRKILGAALNYMCVKNIQIHTTYVHGTN